MKVNAIVLAITLLILTACGSSDNYVESVDTSILPKPELNEGARWKINAEMTPFIRASEKAFKEYVSSGDSDYKALAATLSDNDGKLISACNMEGKAHDQLHVWLMPHIGLVTALANAENDEAAQAQITLLEASFANFNTAFE